VSTERRDGLTWLMNEANWLGDAFEQASRRLVSEQKALDLARDVAARDERFGADVVEIRRTYLTARQAVDDYDALLFNLARRTLELLPDVWPKLRVVTVNRFHHNDNAEVDWSALKQELRVIQSAATKELQRLRDAVANTEPPTATPDGTEPDVDDDRKLSERADKAYQSFQLAENRCEGQLTDREAYDWLKENGPADYDLPDEFTTWQRYVREGRNHFKTQKNLPRRGREGRSLVTGNQVDARHDEDH